MSKLEPLGYQINEVCRALVEGKWRNAIVMERKGSTIYNLMFPDERKEETGEDKFRDIPLKSMSRATIYFCERCGNWFDPAKLPVIGTIDGSTAEVDLAIVPRCPHGDLPWRMNRVPWSEVEGVSAIGGIHTKEDARS